MQPLELVSFFPFISILKLTRVEISPLLHEIESYAVLEVRCVFLNLLEILQFCENLWLRVDGVLFENKTKIIRNRFQFYSFIVLSCFITLEMQLCRYFSDTQRSFFLKNAMFNNFALQDRAQTLQGPVNNGTKHSPHSRFRCIIATVHNLELH